jgi:putative RNA 2'-phosphotransferase
MDAALLKRISKHMSLLLRHTPEAAGLSLDPEGYVHVNDLVAALRRYVPDATTDTVLNVIADVEPQKQRFAIVNDYVRANYGHSLADQIAYSPAQPPDTLFHGTSTAAIASILANGLHPMSRQYVHLTPDQQLAIAVGSRHGKPRLIRVDAHSAFADGQVFYEANRSFWLVASLAPRYLSVEKTG